MENVLKSFEIAIGRYDDRSCGGIGNTEDYLIYSNT